MAWQEHLLQTADGEILWAEAASGPPLLFLHGGPGDEYRYLRGLAELLLADYHCILYDQRGSGGSRLHAVNETTLHPDRFVDDIETLRRRLGAAKITLIGHSWGAILALLYGTRHPQHVAATALVGMGPLSEAWEAVARANRQKALSPAEREELARLSAQRRQALAAGDRERAATLSDRRFRLTAPTLLYRQELLAGFVAAWLAAEPYRNWEVNRLTWPQLDLAALRERLSALYAPTLVLYGYQDFEPITQAHYLQGQMPAVELAFINEAGHLPWLEQPEAVRDALRSFLRRAAG